MEQREDLLMYRSLLAVLIIVLPTPAFGGIANGVVVPGASPSAPAAGPVTVTPPPAGATIINFDDFSAQCLFEDSEPLTSRYASLGVNFRGPVPESGGAILDECSNFSVTGYSAPNFLAFNTGSLLSGGGVPEGPETMTFTNPASWVQINVGNENAGTITLACFVDGSPAGSASVIGASALTTLSVSAPGITSCTLSFTGSLLVADDLAFVVPALEIPTVTEWGLLAFSVLLAVLGVLRLRPA